MARPRSLALVSLATTLIASGLVHAQQGQVAVDSDGRSGTTVSRRFDGTGDDGLEWWDATPGAGS